MSEDLNMWTYNHTYVVQITVVVLFVCLLRDEDALYNICLLVDY